MRSDESLERAKHLKRVRQLSFPPPTHNTQLPFKLEEENDEADDEDQEEEEQTSSDSNSFEVIK